MPPRSQTQSSKRKPGPKRGATGRAAGKRGGKPVNSGGQNNLALGFIAGVLVGGLAVALWYEKNPQAPVDSPVAKTAAPATEAQPADNRKKPPRVGDEFYQQLPEAEVKTFSEKKDHTPLTPYVLQTGAFRSRAEADEMEARIALETGMEAWIDERVSSSGTLWYRVRLGPFEGKRATDRVKRQLWERARIEAVRYQHKPE